MMAIDKPVLRYQRRTRFYYGCPLYLENQSSDQGYTQSPNINFTPGEISKTGAI